MALNIKNAEVERLAGEVAELTGETKTQAVRRALAERRARLAVRATPGKGAEDFLRFLEEEVWPRIPRGRLGRRITKAERERLLGYGPAGV